MQTNLTLMTNITTKLGNYGYRPPTPDVKQNTSTDTRSLITNKK